MRGESVTSSMSGYRTSMLAREGKELRGARARAHKWHVGIRDISRNVYITNLSLNMKWSEMRGRVHQRRLPSSIA